jgi:threonine dehydrogenase-like Zn-dependent dehydrogenase
VGNEVKVFQPGDRVLVGAITPDWGDPAAQGGHASQSGGALGGWKFSNHKDGVFAEYFHVNEADANMAKIPDGVSDDEAVYCADMLSTGFMGAENGNIPIGGTVAVLAQGPVGLMSTAGAKLRGAGLIVGVESVPSRQKLAHMYGADEIVDFTHEDVVTRIGELTQGEGVDTAIEALGADVTFQTAVKITKPGGTVSNTGYFGRGSSCVFPASSGELGWRTRPSRPGSAPGAGCAWSACCGCWRPSASTPRT